MKMQPMPQLILFNRKFLSTKCLFHQIIIKDIVFSALLLLIVYEASAVKSVSATILSDSYGGYSKSYSTSKACEEDKKILQEICPQNMDAPVRYLQSAPIAKRHGQLDIYRNDKWWLNAKRTVWSRGWSGQIPSRDLVAKWVKRPMRSSWECFHKSKVSAADWYPIEGRSGGTKIGYYSAALSRPVYSKDRISAIVLLQINGVRVGTGVWLFSVSRKDGEWKITGKRTLVVT